MTDDKHVSGPPQGAIPLAEAMQRFLPAEMWAEYKGAIEAQRRLPAAPSYVSMNLRAWEAAEARHAALVSATPKPQAIWQKMKFALSEMLKTGKLIAYAQDNPPLGPWHRLSPENWRLLQIKDTAKGTIATKTSVLFDAHVVEATAEAEVDDNMPTAMQGRPTKGREIIREEMERRICAGHLEATLAAQARSLADWYRNQYPKSQAPTVKTIMNNIREQYQRARQIANRPK